MDNFLGWTDDQIEDLINRVYGGVVSPSALPMDLYETILERLDEGIIAGFSGGVDSIAAENLLNKFGENIKAFSFAKTFQQVNDMGNFILDADGNQLAFSEFKKSAAQIFDIYNNNWLETEFNTAKSIAESSRQWVEIQAVKDILPLLQYSTVGDGRVRANHKEIDGIIQPVDSPFWQTHYPPNDFNCRCIVEQIEEGEITPVKINDPINPLFRNNPAISGEVFSKKNHPYFNGLGNLLNAPIKDILPKPKPTPKPSKKYSFKNNKEAKAAIIRDIEANSELKIGKITVSSNLTPEAMAKRADKVKELFSDYNLSETVVNNPIYKGTDITFKSTKRTYGSVRSGSMTVDGERKRFIAKINFGDQTDTGTGRTRLTPTLSDIKGFRHKSAVDPDRMELATNVHEFAHVIVVDRAVQATVFNTDFKFFRDLKKIRTEYVNELREIGEKFADDAQKALEEQYKIHLGKYASTNINEFMAEGFTEYKLHSEPSKYAEKIGKLIDKYYKNGGK